MENFHTRSFRFASKLPRKHNALLFNSKRGSIGVTSILLDDGIDTGQVIYKHSYKLNFDLRLIDHVYDPLIRANHLIETIKMLKLKNFALEQQSDSDSQTYYVIHPVLKHVAIKKGMQICGLE